MQDPNMPFVDTSTPEFQKGLQVDLSGDINDDDEYNDYEGGTPGGDFGDDEDEDFEELDDDLGDDDEGGGDDQTGSTGNEALDAYVDFATKRGIKIDATEFDAQKFSEDDMERLVGKHYAQKYYSHVDPKIVEMAENGVSIDDYIDNRQNLLAISRQDPIQLAKSNIYNQIAEQEHKLGTITIGADGMPDEKSRQYLIEETEKRVAAMGEEKAKAHGVKIQEYYKKSADELPAKLVEQQQQRYKEQMDTWNSQVETMATAVKGYVDKEKALVVEFSGQAEKDDFVNFVKETMKAKDNNGQQVIGLYHRLQNDPKFLIDTLRLLHMNEKGYFTDIKNKERNAAFSKLDTVPVLGKNKTGKQAGQDGRFVDTSHPDYQKNFLKKTKR